MKIPVRGHVVQSIRLDSWYEVMIHIPSFDGLDITVDNTIDFEVTFDDRDAPEVLRLLAKGSKR